jgi:hypothetical protein
MLSSTAAKTSTIMDRTSLKKKGTIGLKKRERYVKKLKLC